MPDELDQLLRALTAERYRPTPKPQPWQLPTADQARHNHRLLEAALDDHGDEEEEPA